jgi:predicted dehydrogenase/nucleoside-diphosphate-sugar epimerase
MRSPPDAPRGWAEDVSHENELLGVGIVGAGRMGLHHASALARLPHYARLVGVADPDPQTLERAQRSLGVAGHGDIDSMLANDAVQVVHICTSPATHFQLADRALAAGRHIYVEKPIVSTVAEMRRLRDRAAERNVQICAGHQLLFEPPMRELRRWLPALGRPVHVESFFSFRTVRRAPGGRVPLRADLQLLDILPHPVYLLLEALRLAAPDDPLEVRGLDVGATGTVHALVARGRVTGTLVVTLEGRPVENYLRVVGTNGSAHADFVRGTVQRLIGPGSSGPEKALNPYRISAQLAGGTTRALSARVLRKQRSYPGLAELFEAFYRSIRHEGPAPTPPAMLMETVSLCEHVAGELERLTRETEDALAEPQPGPLVVLTGGTGFLGKATVAKLLEDGFAIRVLARRQPPAWERLEGASYEIADLGAAVPDTLLSGAQAVIHCAAETAGSWNEHQRNSIDATAHMIRAAASAGVPRFIHVSSMAVLRSVRGAATEESPVETDGRGRGPYVWGKLESERVATDLARELGIRLRIVRPGAIIDDLEYEPPGRLGKRIGPIFVAVGSRRGRFGTVDRRFAADTLAWIVRHFDEAPAVLNLVDPEPPTRGDLVARLRRDNPDVRVVWLPRPVLVPLSMAALLAQKLLRPRGKPIHLARVFADQRLDASRIRSIRDHMQSPAPNPDANEVVHQV